MKFKELTCHNFRRVHYREAERREKKSSTHDQGFIINISCLTDRVVSPRVIDIARINISKTNMPKQIHRNILSNIDTIEFINEN